jgi:outer membrane protein assembly factor BamB
VGADGTVYVASSDGTFYAVDPTAGTMKWKVDIGVVFASSPAIGADGTIYVGDISGVLWAIGS